MKDVFYIKIAELIIKISAIYPLSRQLCSNYIVAPTNADIEAFVTQEEIDADMQKSDELTTCEYAEFICIYRKIAEELPKFNRFVFHGAAISFDNMGYLFTAQSGTGKSTHIALWRKYLGRSADIINGDKPIIWIKNDEILVCSTPWAGKENWQKNRICPLCGIAFLERSKVCFANAVTPQAAFTKILNQVYIPKNAESKLKTFEHIDKLLSNVKLIAFGCDISETAVKTSFEALTGNSYDEKKLKN